MPEIYKNMIGNKICQLFIKEQPAEDRILANIYIDITSHVPCQCTSSEFVHKLLSSHLQLIPEITGTDGTGLYPAMYFTKSQPISIATQELAL